VCLALSVQGLPGEATFDNRLVVALDTDIQTLDPYAHLQGSPIVDGLVHDQLFFRDPKTLRPVPNLAESLKPVDDVTWELRLRPNIRFHNGEPVDAKAVKFTVERIFQPEIKSPYRAMFTWVKEMEVLGDLSLRLVANRPVPSLPDVLTRLHVLPPRYLKEVGDARFGESPVGAGPYRVVSWKPQEPLVLESNDEYRGGPKGNPSIRKITFRVIPDPAERIEKLLAGKVDIARRFTLEQARLLNHSGIVRVSAKPTPRVVFLQMDGDGRASKTPLSDRRVRRAINYALPVDDLVEAVQQKFAVRSQAGLTPLHFGYDPAIAPRPFDLSKARALLNEAGYGEGFEIPLNFSPSILPEADRLSALIVESLEKLGLKVRPRRMVDPYEFSTALRQGKLEGLTLLVSTNGASFDADGIFSPFFHTGQPQAYNSSPDLDKLLDEGRVTIDPERRKAIYSALQKLIVDQAYWVSLYGQYVIEGVNRKLKYEASSDELMPLFSATWNAGKTANRAD
jgi:peptide/nickel transport system substrate-binding protein